MALIDEYHAHPDSSLLDVIDSGMGARDNPLLSIITTAGFNLQSSCYLERNYAISVLRGEVQDDTYFAIIFTLDKGDDWKDEAVWQKSNPNLGVTVGIKDMRRMCNKAIESPVALNNFLTKKLNVWTSQETKFFDMEKWNACDGYIDPEELKGKPCYIAADLASKIDIGCLVALFRMDDGRVAVLPKFYCPKEGARKRSRIDKVPYLVWGEEEHLVLTPGDRIDYDTIKSDIMAMFNKYNVQSMGFDKWNFEYLYQRLISEGVDKEKIYEYPQTLRMMSEPTKELEVLVAEKRIIHNQNPILSWMAGNTAVYIDPNENIRPVKDRSSEKIDGIVATVMALGMELIDQKEESVYEDRGILEF
jgi:phage terminase large subunit-like protein